MPVLAVIGAQWGDEGKGKVVHSLLSEKDYTAVLKGSGGHNCGHTMIHNGNKIVTHAIPAGVLYGITSIIGSGCVVSPKLLQQEIEELEYYGIEVRKYLKISNTAHVITEKHLEEDAGKLTHQLNTDYSLVDFNRAGVPLLELVTKPDFHTASAAKAFCQELQRIVRSLDLSDADMEKGQMRCEANISIAKPKTKNQKPKLGTKVEVKNINSFRAVEKAILYEQERQIDLLEENGTVSAETRTWDANNNKTVVMRSKETSADYRYFPEPDLPAVKIDNTVNDLARLPDHRRQSLVKIGLTPLMAKTLVDKGLDETVLVLNDRDPEITLVAANLLISFPELKKLSAEVQISLISEKNKAGWTKKALEEIIKQLLTGKELSAIVDEHSTDDDLTGIIRTVIEDNPAALKDYQSGKEASFNYLVGQIMARTKGRANIDTVRSTLQEQLKESSV